MSRNGKEKGIFMNRIAIKARAACAALALAAAPAHAQESLEPGQIDNTYKPMTAVLTIAAGDARTTLIDVGSLRSCFVAAYTPTAIPTTSAAVTCIDSDGQAIAAYHCANRGFNPETATRKCAAMKLD